MLPSEELAGSGPPPWSRRWGGSARMTWIEPVGLVSISCRICSSLNSSARAERAVPGIADEHVDAAEVGECALPGLATLAASVASKAAIHNRSPWRVFGSPRVSSRRASPANAPAAPCRVPRHIPPPAPHRPGHGRARSDWCPWCRRRAAGSSSRCPSATATRRRTRRPSPSPPSRQNPLGHKNLTYTDPMKSRPMGRCVFTVMPRLDRGIQTGPPGRARG